MSGAAHYHLVIIGSGQAAGSLAKDAAANGWKVAVIESAHAGRTPAKTPVAGAGIIHAVHQASQWGLNISLAPLSCHVMRGRGMFVGPGTLEVLSADGSRSVT